MPEKPGGGKLVARTCARKPGALSTVRRPLTEAFDLSMVFQAAEMGVAGAIKGPLHVRFVMDVKNDCLSIARALNSTSRP